MPKLTSTGVHDQAATLRQLKILVVLLVLSNLGLGVFGFMLLRTIDRRYSELIGSSIPALSDLQTLTATTVEAMRSTGPALTETPELRREAAVARARAALRSDRDMRETLSAASWMTNEPEVRGEFRKAGEEFTRFAEQVVDLFSNGKMDDAVAVRERDLRPMFDRYLAATGKAADALEADSLRANQDYSMRTGNLSAVMLGLGSWPVIILAALLLLTAVFVVVLMVLFRGREMSDMP